MPSGSRRVVAMSTTPQAPAGALRLGSVAGVPVFIDRTWLLLTAFVAWTGWQAGSGLGAGFGLGYAAWLVAAIFVAVLGHEVGHAVVARMLGFRVHRIVATLWGGHTAYDGTGATPGRSALVALAGPAVNGGLALLGVAAAATWSFPADRFAWSFALVNGLLAIFNVLPGLPLDGGAALQSLVWAVSGRRDLGLVVAGWVGRALAVGIVAWFVLVPFGRGERPEILDVVIALVMAWVLWSGATAAIRRAPVEGVLQRVRVGDVAAPAVLLDPGLPLRQAQEQPDLVVCADERGLPVLVLLGPPLGQGHLQAPPGTSLDAVLTRIPDENVVEAAPEDDIAPVLRAMGTSNHPIVVLTRQGQVWALATARAVDAAADRARHRT